MTASSYDDSLRRLLLHEGGYTDHPSDPGGPTNFGITIADYRKYVKPGATAADVKAMTVAEAKRIYRAKYWDAQRCDELPAGVDYAIFDYGVNSGIGRSKKVLQRIVGVADDGVLGETTMRAIARQDPKALVAAICDERLAFLQRLRTWPVFGKGWGRRVKEVRAAALAMAKDARPAPAPAGAAPGRAVVPVAKGTQQAFAAAVAAAGVAATAQAQQSGAGAGAVIAIAVTACIAAAMAWVFWHWRQRRRQEA